MYVCGAQIGLCLAAEYFPNTACKWNAVIALDRKKEDTSWKLLETRAFQVAPLAGPDLESN
jgi:hypothetical protein